MVRGPGTVGLDASLSAEDVTFTALEALEYYGVYDISRVYDPSSPVPPTPPPRPPRRSKGATRTSNIYPSDETHAENETETERSDNSHLDMLDTIDELSLSPLATTTRYSGRSTTAQRNKIKRRSSLCYRRSTSHKLPGDLGSHSTSSENFDPQYVPELPEEAIMSRRISMGVYEMFTKL